MIRSVLCPPLRFVRKQVALMLALALVMCATSQSFATGVTLPDTGVDVPAIVTATVTFMGTCVSAIILAYAAFRGLKVAMRWFGKVGG